MFNFFYVLVDVKKKVIGGKLPPLLRNFESGRRVMSHGSRTFRGCCCSRWHLMLL